MALNPRAAQLRAATRRATTLILRAEADLEEAGVVLADSFLRTDPQEWIVLRDKRPAALAGVCPRRPEAGTTGRHEGHWVGARVTLWVTVPARNQRERPPRSD
jgi:hypothetical protein